MVLKVFSLVFEILSTLTQCGIKPYDFLELCYLVQVMDCPLIGTRPLPETILTYCSIGIWKKDLENGRWQPFLFRPQCVDVVSTIYIYIYNC